MCSARTGRFVFIFLLLSSCGPAIPTGESARTMPRTADARRAALEEFGPRLYEALRTRNAPSVLFGEEALLEMLDDVAVHRFIRGRVALGTRLGNAPAVAAGFEGTEFLGLCAQGSRVGRATEPPGLLAETWVIDRLLVVASRAGNRRMAAWVEGPFVYSASGFGAVDLRRVEDPRWEHSDLEIGVCDIAFGYRDVDTL